MKTLSLIVAVLVAGFCADAKASGYGVAAVQQNVIVRQRVRQPIFQQRIRQRISLRQQVVAPVYAAPVVAAPVVQSYVAAQAVAVPYVQQIVVPQVQSYVAPLAIQGGCVKGSCAAALGAGCF